jgi:hypothetical protein
MARHRFGDAGGRAYIAGPLIGGGATQIGIMLAHLHAKRNPKALRFAPSVYGSVLGGLVGTALLFSDKYRETGVAALVTTGIMIAPRILEGFMGLGHREEQLKEAELGIITPEQYQALSGFGADDPAVQIMDSGSGSTGMLGTHVAEEVHPLGAGASDYVEMMGFGANFLSQA